MPDAKRPWQSATVLLALAAILMLGLSQVSAQDTRQITTDSERKLEREKERQAKAERLEKTRLAIIQARNPDKDLERDQLFELLKAAISEDEGKIVADAIWRNWLASAPSAEITDLVTQSMERRRWHDYEGARIILNDVVARAPDYAEGWNQRAFIHFLQENFDKSLDDIERALELEPRHFGALSGKARILLKQGRHELGQRALRLAVDIYPLMYERYLLVNTPEDKDQETGNTGN